MSAVAGVLWDAGVLVARGWVRGYSAANDQGQPCGALSQAAVAWCMTGAIRRASHSAPQRSARLIRVSAFARVQAITGANNIADWNDADGRTQQEVVDALLAAASEAEKGTTEENDHDA